jgi:uncharacterized membrane protein (UPF0136 family)
MILPNKKILFLNGVLLAIVLTHSVLRDILFEKEFPCDLRNRVVGARLQKDGKLPYHFHWRTADGIRYYNQQEDQWVSSNGRRQEIIPQESDISKITASPFFHELLYPICDLPQRTISRIWFWGQYILLACIIGMISGLTKDNREKWLLLNIGVLFTTTEAWKASISAGQLYLVEAFLMCCILTALVKNTKNRMIIGGICAFIFILTRPIGIILFIPFLIYYRKFMPFILTSFGGFIFYGIFVFASPAETAVYKDYINGMKMHVQLHQDADNGFPPAHITEESRFSNLEGFDIAETERLPIIYPIKIYSENGNIFVIYYRIFHRKLPLNVLITGMFFTVCILTVWFFMRSRKYTPQVLQILIFSLSLYMIVEIFNPIYRHQYNTVQWFPLVLAGFLPLPDWNNKIFIFLILGLVLNIVNLNWLPMRHTLGEFCWLTGLLMLVFSTHTKQVT